MPTPRQSVSLLLLSTAVVLAVGSPVRADFLVSVSNNAGSVNEVQRYTDSGTYVGVFASGGGLSTPEGLAYGPNGNLFVMSYANGCILQYNGTTGAFINCITNDPSGANTGIGLKFSPDGKNMFVTNFNSNNIQEYNVASNTWTTFASGGSLNGPLDLSFLANGNLIVSNSNTHSVLQYSALGVFLGSFVAAGSGGLNFPDGQATKAGSLYVSSSGTNQVLKYDATTGASQGLFANIGLNASPIGLLFQPNGNLLVAANGPGQIQQYDAVGNLIGTFGLAHMGGAAAAGFPTYLVQFVPEPSSFVLAGLGATGLLAISWRRRKADAA